MRTGTLGGWMMPRVGRAARRSWVTGTVLAAVLALGWIGVAAATVFDVPPKLGDRRVDFSWQPDADDPIYNGNTVLQVASRVTTIHGSGRDVQAIVSSGDGSLAYSFAAGEQAIREWRVLGGTVQTDLPLGPAGAPLALALHASDLRLLAALPDGRIGLWRLNRPGPVEILPGGGGVLRALLCYPGVRDTTTLPFVSVGVDDSLRVWAGPGELLGPRYVIPIPGGTTRALSITSDRRLVAVGTQDGAAFLIERDDPPASARLGRGEGRATLDHH